MNIFIQLFEHQQWSSLISFLGFLLLWVLSGKVLPQNKDARGRNVTQGKNFESKIPHFPHFMTIFIMAFSHV